MRTSSLQIKQTTGRIGRMINPWCGRAASSSVPFRAAWLWIGTLIHGAHPTRPVDWPCTFSPIPPSRSLVASPSIMAVSATIHLS
ncbi:hypothetical protein BU23DRAFT_253908 [Bimuria novae-zelandiae CBS 107.79]|uniref:Uncharacterized protein n=1 Tax=Bimuria novae-zelandiae CBS 107.79 TaxID=1447943 RepID=A0A6A5VMX6_9PLEO|nr:hypothetical protein BU23DRAFT_253908 [Bimuria novae-zelandiae CBS 107.79]